MKNLIKVSMLIVLSFCFTQLFAASSTDTSAQPSTMTNSDSNASMSSGSNSSMQPSTKNVSDSAITSSIKSQFLSDKTLLGSKIKVMTKNGIVTLKGTAKSQTQIDEATNLAKATNGVKDVQTQVTVKESAGAKTAENM